MPKRARKEDAAEAAADAPTKASKKTEKKATATAATPKGDDPNARLMEAFDQLRYYESKGGNKWAAVAYGKVVTAIRNHKSVISSGADMKSVAGVGDASIKKIDEFLSTGGLKKIDEFKAIHGPVPSEFKSAGGKTVAAGGAKGKAGSDVKGTPPTKAQLKDINKEKETFAALRGDDLKAQLRANRQKTTGTKDELVERCAQGKVLGAIPSCPLCSAGRPRFDMKTGVYKCPGYMDDDTFMPCSFTAGSMVRTKWVSS